MQFISMNIIFPVHHERFTMSMHPSRFFFILRVKLHSPLVSEWKILDLEKAVNNSIRSKSPLKSFHFLDLCYFGPTVEIFEAALEISLFFSRKISTHAGEKFSPSRKNKNTHCSHVKNIINAFIFF